MGGKRWMVNDDALDLLNRIFKLEKKRITMEEVLSHPFVGLIDVTSSEPTTEISATPITTTARIAAPSTSKPGKEENVKVAESEQRAALRREDAINPAMASPDALPAQPDATVHVESVVGSHDARSAVG